MSRAGNIHRSALASCIVYIFRHCELMDMSDPGLRQIESCPTFFVKDSEAFWLRLNEKVCVSCWCSLFLLVLFSRCLCVRESTGSARVLYLASVCQAG